MINPQPNEWHREVISETTQNGLRALHDANLVQDFYLAGGTGLALHLGHRLSQDLDFFANDLFDEEQLLQRAERLGGISLVSKAPHSLHTVIRRTKVSFLGYSYPLLFPLGKFDGVSVADSRDIACMKISALAGRGTKRDFVDLYMAAQHFGLNQLLEMFHRKYAQTAYNKIHVLKSLSFFEDAEKDPMPSMLVAMNWNDVKAFFRRQAPRIE